MDCELILEHYSLKEIMEINDLSDAEVLDFLIQHELVQIPIDAL